MKLFADYHTHTIYSHGKGSIMDNVIAARKMGLKEIAITDHGIRHFTFGVKLRDIMKMREEIDRINTCCQDVKVLLGLECNIISTEGDIDIYDSVMKYLDILLVGYHMMVLPKNIKEAIKIYGKNYTEKLLPGLIRGVRESNTEAMIRAIGKYDIDIITHPGARINIDTTEVAKAASRAGTAMEINSHNNKMSVDFVKAAAVEGVMFAINSDAHKPDDVGNLAYGVKIAEQAGLNSTQIINAVK
ncbi:MAG: PHP domain-containing protein [Bacillota bacterium]